MHIYMHTYIHARVCIFDLLLFSAPWHFESVVCLLTFTYTCTHVHTHIQSPSALGELWTLAPIYIHMHSRTHPPKLATFVTNCSHTYENILFPKNTNLSLCDLTIQLQHIRVSFFIMYKLMFPSALRNVSFNTCTYQPS